MGTRKRWVQAKVAGENLNFDYLSSLKPSRPSRLRGEYFDFQKN
jgi:hypothetical protein